MVKEVLQDGWLAEVAIEDMKEYDRIGFDTETSSLLGRGPNNSFEVIGIALATVDDSFYIPINHKFYDKNFSEDRVRELLSDLFSQKKEFIAHDFKFDRHVLNRIGIEVNHKNAFDTLIAGRMVNENKSNSLENLIERHLVEDKELLRFDDVVDEVPKEIKKKAGLKGNEKATFDLVPMELAVKYALEDVEYLIELKEFLTQKLKEEGQFEIYDRYMVPDFNHVLYDMETYGVRIDKDRLTEMGLRMEEDISQMKDKMKDIVGFEINYNSPIQISELLYNEYISDPPCDTCKKEECDGLCKEYDIWNYFGHKNPNVDIRMKSFNFPIPERTETGQPSSGKKALKRFQHYAPKNEWQEKGLEFINTLLDYKKVSKLKSTFIDGVKDVIYDDGRVHPSFNQIAASSGRLSSSDPNGQNLPDQDEEDNYKIRDMFVPSDDSKIMLAFDYSNLEMMLLAHYSEDPRLLEMFEKGHDAHGSTAVNMFDLDCHPDEAKKKYPTERAMGKTLNFALMYGMSADSLYYTLKDIGVELEDPDLQKEYGAYNGKDLARVIYDTYFETYEGVREFINGQRERGRKNKEVFTLLGRKRRLPGIDSDDRKKRGYYERLATNAPIQGSAADVIMCAQIKLFKNEKLSALGLQQLLQVHDELVMECPRENYEEAIPIIKEEMETPFNGEIPMNVDLKVDYDIGESYYEAK